MKAPEEDRCPACDADLTGDPIPERHHYGTATHYSRKIGLTDMERDRTTHYRCPDCGHTWKRE